MKSIIKGTKLPGGKRTISAGDRKTGPSVKMPAKGGWGGKPSGGKK